MLHKLKRALDRVGHSLGDQDLILDRAEDTVLCSGDRPQAHAAISFSRPTVTMLFRFRVPNHVLSSSRLPKGVSMRRSFRCRHDRFRGLRACLAGLALCTPDFAIRARTPAPRCRWVERLLA